MLANTTELVWFGSRLVQGIPTCVVRFSLCDRGRAASCLIFYLASMSSASTFTFSDLRNRDLLNIRQDNVTGPMTASSSGLLK